MGGKSSTTTQGISIPPSVLAQYQSVNAQAQNTAQTPFKTYNQTGTAVAPGYTNANSGTFVAPVNAQQQSGIAATNTAAGQAQPYFGAATGLLGNTQAATAGVNSAAEGATEANSNGLSSQQIDQYLSPYLGTVLGSTEALQNQENQQQQAGQLGTAISSGAFGGDRTGIAAANLAQQQQLANSNVLAGIANTGYQSALGTAQGEQQIGLQGAEQLAGIGQTAYGEGANTATTLAGLGTGAQTAGLQGANAEIAAGTVEQQTQQAEDAAEYNQFEQQQSYPFQVDQFLANIAEGTGALSGSTTTTTQPGGFFSDKRLKHDIKPIGKTYDGQRIYSYKMHGDPRTHIGLIAQQVERKHPEAVGLHGGFKTVDYGDATEDAAKRGKFYAGGLARTGFAGGGPSLVDQADLAAILAAQHAMYAPYSGGAGPYGTTVSMPYGGSAHVPPASGAVAHLVTAQGGLRPQPSAAQNAATITDLANKGTKFYRNVASDVPQTNTDPDLAGLKAGGRAGFDDGGLADVLSAQQAMYQKNSPQQREIPAQTQSHQLAVASGTPAPPPSGASNVSQALGMANNASKLYDRFGKGSASQSGVLPNGSATTAPTIDYSSELSAPLDAGAIDAAADAGADAAGSAAIDDAALAALGAKRGGKIKRSGLGSGGMPYSNDGELDIPDTNSGAANLKTAGPIQKIPTGLQDLEQMSNPLNLASSIGNVLSNEAVATGGKIGAKQRPKRAIGGLSNAQLGDWLDPNSDAGGENFGVTDPDQPWGPNDDIGGDRFGVNNPDEPWKMPTLAKNFGVTNPKSWEPNDDMGGNRFGATPGGWDGKSAGLNASTPNALPPREIAARTPPTLAGLTWQDSTNPTVDAGDVPEVKAPGPSIWDKIKGSGITKPENYIPILSAIGAMGTAPTRHLGVALASGLQAGANSYFPAQEAAANVAQTQAATGNIAARTQGQNIANIAQLKNVYAARGMTLYEDPNGRIPGPDGKRYSARPITYGMAQGQVPTSAPEHAYLGNFGLQTARDEGVRYSLLPEDAQSDSQKKISQVYESGNLAQARLPTIQRWEEALASNPDGKFLAPGALNDIRTQAANLWNTTMDQFGHPEFKVSGLNDALMAAKTSKGAAAMAEAENQQRSLAALNAFLNQTPNTSMPREAALPLIADMHMENTQAIDKKNYLDEFDRETQRNYGAPMQRNYLASDALNAFDHDHNAADYEGERNKLQKLLLSRGFNGFSRNLQNASDEKKRKYFDAIDAEYGKNFHRYFTGT